MKKEEVIGRYFYNFSLLIIAVALFSVLVLAQDDAVQDSASTIPSEEETSSQIPEDIAEGETSQPLQEPSVPPSDEGNVLEEDEKEFQDAELEQGAGITPDSAFYFIDKFFDRFGSDLANREEKIAEIKAMIQAGKIEEAKEALRRYKEYAKKVEAEIDPEHQNEARRSAVAIKKTIEEIEGSIPEEDKEEFNEVIKSEGRIAAAAKIANKIKELCESLSKLDPIQYEQVCRLKDEDDAPRWQRRLDQKLTKEQEQEAERFFRTMSNCFKYPDTCHCEEISVPAFAEKCKVVAPLAAKCKQGDEDACDQMDRDTEGMEDLLPEYLQHVMERVEEEFGDAEFDNHMPPECREAGIDFKDRDARRKCGTVMFEANAPEECVKALKEGKLDISNERKAREQCEEIMFRENAPQECIDAGIKNFKECGKFMFKQNAPKECVDAGLTGESPRDHRKCEEIMRKIHGEDGGRGRGPGGRGPPAFGRNCKDIQDSAEKIKCLEEFYNAAQQGGFPGQGGPGGEGYGPSPEMFPPECREAKALTKEACESIMKQKYGEGWQPPQGGQKCPDGVCDDFERNNPGACQQDCGGESQPYPQQPSGEPYQQPSQPGPGCDCRNVICSAGNYPTCKPGSSTCECVSFEHFEQQPPPSGDSTTEPPSTTEPVPPPSDTTSPPPEDTTQSPSTTEPVPPPSDTTSPPPSEPVSISDNRFVQYYFRLL